MDVYMYYVCVCVYMYACVCVYTYIHTYICSTNAAIMRMWVCTNVCVYFVRVCVCVCVCMCVHIYIRRYIHIYPAELLSSCVRGFVDMCVCTV